MGLFVVSEVLLGSKRLLTEEQPLSDPSMSALYCLAMHKADCALARPALSRLTWPLPHGAWSSSAGHAQVGGCVEQTVLSRNAEPSGGVILTLAAATATGRL